MSILRPETIIRRLANKKKAIKTLQEQIIKLQERCDHKWKKQSTHNDSDGWSVNVPITWTTYYVCEICDKNKTKISIEKGY